MVLSISPGTSAMETQPPTKFVPVNEETDEEECKIHISNIPHKLRGQGLKNLFLKFGNVVRIYHPSGSRWAFVTYSNKAECEIAIMRIQDVLGMKADFAIKKEKREVEDMLDQYPILPIPDPKPTPEEEAAMKTTPFHLPTFEYKFPPLLVTEEDYKNPKMMSFDPKREYLISHDMFWALKLRKEFEKKEKPKKSNESIADDAGGEEISQQEIFSLNSPETVTVPDIVCVCCQNRRSFYECPRCKTPFCSTKCSNLYRKNHLRYCGKVVPEEPIENPKMPQPRVEFPKSKSQVSVISIYNPREIFVRSLASDANFGYLQTLNKVHGHAVGAKYLTESPQPNSMVLAKRKKFFTRAFVVSTEEDHATVILFDFGSIQKVPWRELKETCEELTSLPRYVFKCHLKDVKAVEYNAKIREYIQTYDEMKIIYDSFDQEEIPEITLKSHNGELTENEEIKKMLQRFLKKVTIETPSLAYVPETPTWPTKDVEIIILENSTLNRGYISCAIYTQYIEFLHQWEVMQLQCDNLGDIYVPLRDTMSLVRLEEDGKWHRAMCNEANHYKILNIMLVDSGQMGNVSTSNSRKLPGDFDFPSPLKICKIKGLPDKLDEDRVEELKKLLPQNRRLIAKELVEDEENILLTLEEVSS
ncbi:protein vreteno [Lutzomyia longipalpis]|uniref:protein vreteno n=1 Tax=Lutzomyia longipalpis TaxID=7200 RepID=UPI002483E1AC|nr:protein vreteno [Lutzomyia longipalpis]